MTDIKRLLTYLILAPIMILASCQDDLLYDPDNFGDGEGDLRATVEFKNLEEITVSRAGTNGDVINTVNDMWVVLYHVSSDGSLDPGVKYHVSEGSEFGYSCNQTGNTAEPGDASVSSEDPKYDFESTKEPATPRASFTIKGISFGRYKMYAVANVDLTNVDVSNEEDLLDMRFKWNNEVKLNNQMFGYFTLAEDPSSQGFGDGKYVIVNKKTVDVHSWIKRLVSKVTVAFDTRNLKESIWIYIKSVTIHDIPESCYLGKNNTPNNADQLIENGDSIVYYDKSDPDNRDKWLIMTKSSGVKGSKHGNADESLFFFENMQGDYQNKPEPERKDYLKEQIPEETGHKVDTFAVGNDYKDRIRNGSYIEVIAYYRSQNTEKMSSGKIKYRFMLGKNITYNYDAERNYHYKLTLKFRGFANEADWHISYDEPTPSVYTPENYYISYLYGQSLNFPVRIVTGDDKVSEYILKAHIEENAWYPWDESANKVPPQTEGAYDDINGFAWNVPAYNTTYKNQNYVGFLSMRQPESGNLFQDLDYGEAANTKLKNYYENNNIGESAYTLKEGTRNVGLYNTETKTFVEGDNSQGEYTVTYDQDGSATVLLPMYTRQKQMVPATDFSGNNPFPYYQRRAVVVFTLWDKSGTQVKFKDIKDDSEYEWERRVPIMQVRRIENPKAIYRAHDNDDPFEIKLMHLLSPTADSFTEFKSQGPWRVSIVSDPKGLVKLTSIDGSVEVTNSTQNKYIEGSTETIINFKYTPRGKIESDETRCAIILVEYHDYSCNHLIFLRQGYHKGVQLGSATWSCYQVYATGTEGTSSPQFSSNSTSIAQQGYNVGIEDVCVAVTRNPLSIGSFYKRNAYNYGIREANNVGSYGWMKSVGTNDLSTTCLSGTSFESTNNRTVQTRDRAWNNIDGMSWTSGGGAARNNEHWADTWTTVDYMPGKKLTVPTSDQYISLLQNSDFGFGVAYGDGADSTAVKIDDVYGFIDKDNSGNGSNKGVRVCVAYNSNNADNILFPLGAVGQGRRSITFTSGGADTPLQQFADPKAGALTYSGMRGLLTSDINKNRPLTYNIYRDPGALYWIKQPVGNGIVNTDYASWDINYFTLQFNHYSKYSLWRGSSGRSAAGSSDALPIKLIYK